MESRFSLNVVLYHACVVMFRLVVQIVEQIEMLHTTIYTTYTLNAMDLHAPKGVCF
jgi:hypothetical protein